MMNALNAAFPLGAASIGFMIAYWLGALALLHKRRADQIRERLLPISPVDRLYIAYAAPRFLGS
jgi:hypothetical protein